MLLLQVSPEFQSAHTQANQRRSEWCAQNTVLFYSTHNVAYLLLKESETGICSGRFSSLLLTDWLEATLEVLLLFVQTLCPALHVLGDLTHNDTIKSLQLNLNNWVCLWQHCSISIRWWWCDLTCCAVLLLGFSFFSLLSFRVEDAEAAAFWPASPAGIYVCFSLSQYRYCCVWEL